MQPLERIDRTIPCTASSQSRAGESVSVPKDTDQELVRRVKKGDRRAFDLLFSRYQHKIYGLVSRFVRDQQDIDDVVQEAFIKAYRALPRFRGESAFYTWLYRIAINTAKNYLLARGRRPPAADIDAEDAEFMDGGDFLRETENPENQLSRDELENAINEAISRLPDDLRSAVTLREFDGLTYEQIAVIMECPVGTVRSRIFRAREAIDQQIQPYVNRS
jgi:RNA polymerase sigma-70 factor (ECF subfamily)